MPTPEEWAQEVDKALFGEDLDEARQSEPSASPESLFGRDTEAEHHGVALDDVDAALFGGASANGATARTGPPEAIPSQLGEADEAILVYEDEPDADAWDDEIVADGVDAFAEEDETIVAEIADVGSAGEAAASPERGRRRAVVLAGFTALVVIIGASIGAVAAGRSGGSDPGKKTVPERTAATTTTTTTTTTPQATTAPAASVPPPAPRSSPTTSRRTGPAPSTASAPAPVDPPPPSPPPETPTSPTTVPPPTTVGP